MNEINTTWHVATITSGFGTGGFSTGSTCVFRLRRDGDVAVIAHSNRTGGAFARVTLDEAKRRLRTVRTSDGQPVRARGQGSLRRRWGEYECRAGRNNGYPLKPAWRQTAAA